MMRERKVSNNNLAKKNKFALKVGGITFFLSSAISWISLALYPDPSVGGLFSIFIIIGFIFASLLTLTIISYNHMHYAKNRNTKIGLMTVFFLLASLTSLFLIFIMGAF